MLIRHRNMPKTKFDGDEDHTISIQMIAGHFEYTFKSVHRPEPIAVFHINRSRQTYSLATSVIEDSNNPPTETNAK